MKGGDETGKKKGRNLSLLHGCLKRGEKAGWWLKGATNKVNDNKTKAKLNA